MSTWAFSLETGDGSVWDRWVMGSPDPHHEQMSAWGDAQSMVGWTPLRLLAYRGSELVGGVQILEKPVRRVGRVAYINRGPLANAGGEDGGVFRRALVGEMARIARVRRHIYQTVVLPYGGEGFMEPLRASGYFPQPAGLPPVRYMTDTACLNLEPTLDEILSGMRSSTRKHIRQGLKRGLKVRVGGESDLGVFDDLLDALCQRRGVRRNIPRHGFLQRLWRGFSGAGNLQVFVAEHQDQPIAILLVFAVGDWVREWRIGWNGEHADLLPNELLRWEVMRWAKERGLRRYDFCGVDSSLARKVATGEEIPAEEMTGPSWFKLGFGGRPMALCPDFCRFTHPMARWIMSRYGAQVLAWPVVRRLIRNAA